MLTAVFAEPDLRRIQLASAISTTARWSYLVALLGVVSVAEPSVAAIAA